MTESQFHSEADAVFARIEAALEAQGELDFDREGGVLTIEAPDASKVIINRQAPNREIWVAARSGGFHFRLREDGWRDTRSGEPLFTSLSAILAAQAGVLVDLG